MNKIVIILIWIVSYQELCQSAPPSLEEIFRNDNFIWLEDRRSKRATDWVNLENEITRKKIIDDELFKLNYKILQNALAERERVPSFQIEGAYAYALFKEKSTSRGQWRRISKEQLGKPLVDWEVVVDFDIISKKEKQNLNFYEARCLKPESRMCLMALSETGGDEIEIREFDTLTKKFVRNGFKIEKGRSTFSWVDKNHIAIAKDFGNRKITQSGFGSEMRILSRRGEKSDSKTLLEVPTDYFTITPYAKSTHAGMVLFASRYHSEGKFDDWIIEDNIPIPILIPNASPIFGVTNSWVIFLIKEDWKVSGQNFKANTILGVKLADILKNKGNEGYKVHEIYAPVKGEYLSDKILVTKDFIVVNPIEKVQGRIKILKFDGNKTVLVKELDLKNKNLSLLEADYDSNTIFFNSESFVTPRSVVRYDIENQKMSDIYQSGGAFDSRNIIVNQQLAKSDDGKEIPFFIVGRKDVLEKGNAPTIVKIYGGYGMSLLPTYDVTYGKLWLEKGGVFVVGNIRGGGELGPEWHKAGSHRNKIKSVEDLISIGKELTNLKITRPEKLGIYGGSLAGLVVGGAMAKEPKLFKAVVAVVPDFDMLRGHQIGGGSWMGEVGDPRIAEDRAAMLLYSPYHSINNKIRYPSLLAFSTTTDDRVHPAHARKFIAKLKSFGNKNTFYYEASDGGHKAANTLDQTALWKSLQMTFFARELGL